LNKKISANLITLASNIDAPQDYLNGFSFHNSFAPDNILVFCRIDSSLLPPQGINHHRFVLIISLRGKGQVIIDDKVLPLTPGDATLILPFQLHSYAKMDNNPCWLFITFEARNATILSPLQDSIITLLQKNINQLNKLIDIFTQVKKNNNNTIQLITYLNNFLNEILQLPRITISDETVSPYNELIQKVETFVKENITKQINIVEIAKQFSLSKNYLSSIFRNQYGVTLGQYILTLRINTATRLLIESNLKVADIAKRCGFESSYSFGRAFKRKMTISPREYRQFYKSGQKNQNLPIPSLKIKS